MLNYPPTLSMKLSRSDTIQAEIKHLSEGELEARLDEIRDSPRLRCKETLTQALN